MRSAGLLERMLEDSSCSNAYAAAAPPVVSEDIVRLATGEHERARVLELAHDADDPALGLLHDALALRRLVLHLLDEHLRAALGHVREDPILDLVGYAAQGERQVLLVRLAEHELNGAVVELDDVLEDEQQA